MAEGKTYILNVKQSYDISEGELHIMDKALKKKRYFREMYFKYELDSIDISYN